MAGLGFFDIAALVLLLASIVGCLNELYWRLPRAIALLVASLALSFAMLLVDTLGGTAVVASLRQSLDQADLPHVFLDGALAFLLFAGTLQVNLADLRQRKWIILPLSTASVMVATAAFGFGMWGICRAVGVPIPLGWCTVLGAILAPTDAVVVHTLLSRLPLPTALRAMIAGESLFNDGAGVVMFLITLGIAAGEKGLIGHGQVVLALAVASLGGAAIGGACGFVAGWVTRRIGEPVLQLTITLALAAGSYRLADTFGVSGPIAVVTAGLALSAASNTGPHPAIVAFWSLLDELLNAVLFLLMGVQVLALSIAAVDLVPMLLAIPLSLASRLVSVIVPVAFHAHDIRGAGRVLTVMVWSGLRGGVSVALALTMPPSPYRDALLVSCYAVVVFTIVVQGLTMERVLRFAYKEDWKGSADDAD